MIYVKEIIPRKISGLTSFLVMSDRFSEELLSIIDSLTTSYYFKKEYIWEISSVDLKLFLDQATILDDIKLELIETSPNFDFCEVSDEEQVELIKDQYKPFKHQIEAINYTLLKKKWLLLDGMGVGKSCSIIYSAEILHKRGLIDHCLIICGVNAVKENWANEIERFSHESYMILGKKIGKRGGISYATIAERCEILKNEIKEFFIITNIETIRDEKIVKAIQTSKNKFGMIAVDEVHRCNNKKSSQGNHLLKLDADYKIAATGTLITNSPASAYLPLVWTENDHSILTTFKPQYFVYGGFNDSQIVGYKNLDVLQEEIDACSLRRTLDMVRDDMPEKIVDYEILELSKEHQKFYDDIKAGVKSEADKIELNAANLLALTIRLRQAAVCPSILTTNDVKSTKLERCKELVEDLISQGEKVIVLSVFKQPIYQLAELLASFNPLVVTGDTNEAETTSKIHLFKTSTDAQILLGTGQKIGTGISLPECHYMILLDLPYTNAELAQWTDRIYRVNSTYTAYIKILVGKDTIDERIQEIIEVKRGLADYLVDNKLDSSTANNLEKIIKNL